VPLASSIFWGDEQLITQSGTYVSSCDVSQFALKHQAADINNLVWQWFVLKVSHITFPFTGRFAVLAVLDLQLAVQ